MRRRQRGVERLVIEIRAAEEMSDVRCGGNLALVRLGKSRAGSPVRVDDLFGEEILNLIFPVLGYIGREQMVEAAIFANNDDDVLDRARGLERVRRSTGTDRLCR